MPRYLRADIRTDRWLSPPWLSPGAVPASAVADLRPYSNELSFFEVPDDADNAFIERIVVAFAAKRDKVDKVGYIVFDGAALPGLGLNLVPSPGAGDTPDAVVNALHCDLPQMTGQNLLDLVGVMSGSAPLDILAKRLTSLLQTGVDNRHLDKSRMNRKLLTEIGRI